MSAGAPVLITRALPEAEETAKAVAALGFKPRLAPMLTIHAVPLESARLAGVQALLATSRHAASALIHHPQAQALPVLTVGDATARAFRDIGCPDVRSAGRDVRALTGLVAETLRPADGPLVHLSGREVAGDLAGDLARKGFDARRAIVYRAETAQALAASLFDPVSIAALFYSPRGAAAFARLLPDPALVRPSWAFAFSPLVADAVAGLPWRGVRVAETPQEGSLLRLLEPLSGGRG